MYLDTIYISTEFWPNLTSNMAAKWPSWKTNKVLITPELMVDHLQIFIIGTSNGDAWHDTQVFDLTYFLKVTEVKVQNGTNIGTFHSYLT
jgi:hypothetical protein